MAKQQSKLHPALAAFRGWHPTCNAYCRADVHAIVGWFNQGATNETLEAATAMAVRNVYSVEMVDVRYAPEAGPIPSGSAWVDEDDIPFISNEEYARVAQPILIRFRVPAGVD